MADDLPEPTQPYIDPWETVYSGSDDGNNLLNYTTTDRLEVMGGWLYRTREYVVNKEDTAYLVRCVAMVFVPDAG